jgi:hypothetical protein
MLPNSIFHRWNDKDRKLKLSDFQQHILNAHMDADNDQQREALETSFPEIFDYPELTLNADNIQKFTVWLSDSDMSYDVSGFEVASDEDLDEVLTPEYFEQSKQSSHKIIARKAFGGESVEIIEYYTLFPEA